MGITSRGGTRRDIAGTEFSDTEAGRTDAARAGRTGQVTLRPERRRFPVPALAAVWSAVTLALGLWWWLRPGSYPFAPVAGEPSGTLLDVVPASAVPPVLVGAGLAGMGVAALAGTGRARGVVGGTAVGWVLVFGLAVPGLQPLTLIGYAMAMLGPPVLFATVLAGAWRWRGGPAAVAVFVLAGVVAWTTGLADAEVLVRYGAVITSTVEKAAPSAIMLFFLVGALVWAVLGARSVQGGAEQAPAWTRPEAAARWGRAAVVVAVVCALPYGLHRLTWLTPRPLGMDAAALAAQPEMRLHGLLLGLAALAGAVLTSGLVARWGEVWPRWMPVVRGRRVPLAAAVVPGTLVAALFTVAAVPMILMSVRQGALWGLLVFPFPVWGPALGLAVLGYVLRRRGESVRPGTIEGS
ncbi:hypothetical protein [Pseudonocardia sp. MH-G8]|uniref:hypothetical protein n=1 Tax=Pseudonocardia sp. MH-G8 TaxID=1854588 RepID=UPI000BA0DE0D|nr:hypothetical protein [Pseudonocardia sp. MH-G8]OZM78360.1 hypothetical protein CFP66_30575 [Pseudonocardia sp. MH-G8]